MYGRPVEAAKLRQAAGVVAAVGREVSREVGQACGFGSRARVLLLNIALELIWRAEITVPRPQSENDNFPSAVSVQP